MPYYNQKQYNMNVRKWVGFTFLLLGVNWAVGQSQKISFTSDDWKFANDDHRIETFKGKECLYLGPGYALNKTNFKNGVIDFDISFSEKRQFSGVFFRRVDDKNYEDFYLRPHQSGNPDANQYTPVFNGLSGWQLYHGEDYAMPYKYRFDEWMHVRLVIVEDRMEIYIDDMEKPLIYVPQLKRDIVSGGFGFKTGRNPVRIANVQVEHTDNAHLHHAPKVFPVADKGTIMQWMVSNTIAPNEIIQNTSWKPEELPVSNWKVLESEYNGMANLASVADRTPEKNAVLAKVIIHSERDQVKQFEFGYSDIVHLYCNGQLLFAGSNQYMTRDYRYLGTIGYFESVFLRLKEGENEIWMVVTENFGGWGVAGKFDNMEGLTIKK